MVWAAGFRFDAGFAARRRMDPFSSGREDRDREVLASRAVCPKPGFHTFLYRSRTDEESSGLFDTQEMRDLMGKLPVELRNLEGYVESPKRC